MIPNFFIFFNFFSKLIVSKFFYCIHKNKGFDFYLKRYDLVFFTNFIKLNSLLKFDTLIDIAVVDFQQSLRRFKLVYNFLSYSYKKRITLNYFINELAFANSIKKIFIFSDWIEREVWDMFGIFFLNHNDVRRILTDYGFKGYPLKKDFPLSGYLELRFDDSRRDVFYEPIELAQELRFFNFSSGWEISETP